MDEVATKIIEILRKNAGGLDKFLSLFQCPTCPRISYDLARDH